MKENEIKTFLVMKFTTQHVLTSNIKEFVESKLHCQESFNKILFSYGDT